MANAGDLFEILMSGVGAALGSWLGYEAEQAYADNPRFRAVAGPTIRNVVSNLADKLGAEGKKWLTPSEVHDELLDAFQANKLTFERRLRADEMHDPVLAQIQRLLDSQ